MTTDDKKTMKKPGFFARSELTATLWAFRREFLAVGLFSMLANLLMLTPTIYMLQVYDRVLASGSEMTLLAVSLLALFLLIVMAVAEWSRSRVLVRAGVRLDQQLSTPGVQREFRGQPERVGQQPGAGVHRSHP
jgi:ATP-binding cassette subfamily C exporter for protease/lipase